jgi:hypothetical protein
MRDDDDQFESLDTGRFRLIKRFKWQILLVLLVGGFIIINNLPPPWAGGQFPYIPKYPGSSVIESHVYDPQLLVGKDPVAARMVMDMRTDSDYFKSIGSASGSYSDAYGEFAKELADNNWIRAGISGCQDYVWWNLGYPATKADLSTRQDDSKIWTLVVESQPAENKTGVTRLTFTVTKGYTGCSGDL